MILGPVRRTVVRISARSWLAVLLIVIWQVLRQHSEQTYFPPPTTIISATKDLWFSGPVSHLFLSSEGIDDFVPSITHLFAGWILASAVGITLGVALGRSRTASDYFDPLLQFGRAIPPPTLIPVFIIVFHLGATMQIASIVFGVVWPVLLNTIDGARAVDTLQLDTAEVFGITGWQRLTKVILPAASPKIFAGLRVSLSFAVILMVVSELIGGTTGIGARLALTQRSFILPQMWGSIIVLSILGYLLNEAFLLVERRLLAWHAGARRLET